jgi:hypothetical protein
MDGRIEEDESELILAGRTMVYLPLLRSKKIKKPQKNVLASWLPGFLCFRCA